MLPSRGSDLAAPRGRSQHRSTFLHRETLISPSESPRKAQEHVLRYNAHMHRARSTGPWPTCKTARTSKDPLYTIVRSRSTSLETAPSPLGQGAACSPRSPPDLHLPYLPWYLPRCPAPAFLCFAWVPDSRLSCHTCLWLQPRCLRTEDKDRLRCQARSWCGNGTERHSQFDTGYVDSRSSQPHDQPGPQQPE